MFRLSYDDVIWQVEFHHERYDPPRHLSNGHPIHGSTRCDIHVQAGESMIPVIHGGSWCLVADHWSRSEGRRLALRRAVKMYAVKPANELNESVAYTCHRNLSRDFRRLLWACYWIMSRRLDRVDGEHLVRGIEALQKAGTKIPSQRVQGVILNVKLPQPVQETQGAS